MVIILQQPKISVVMSVYNGEKYLREAIDSILNQTFGDFEFIIVDDGSTDKTAEIIDEYAKKDLRVKIIKNKNNIGLTKSLNKAIQETKGEYIARMDADDISSPERFDEQLTFIENHPEIGAVGCWYYLIDKNNKLIKKVRPPVKFYKIKKAILNSTPIIHPAAMIRKISLEKINYYDESFKYAQDRDLLFRILNFYQLGVVPKYLLKYRYTKQSISLQREIEQKKYCLKAIRKVIKKGIYPKWYYFFTIRHLISIYLPKPLRIFKNNIFNKLGLRHEQD